MAKGKKKAGGKAAKKAGVRICMTVCRNAKGRFRPC